MGDDRLSCIGLTKVYKGSEGKKALDGVTLDVPARGIFSLIGMNGAGKTTLVRILATQLEPTGGEARIRGLDVVEDAKKLRTMIASIPQEARSIPWMTPPRRWCHTSSGEESPMQRRRAGRPKPLPKSGSKGSATP